MAMTGIVVSKRPAWSGTVGGVVVAATALAVMIGSGPARAVIGLEVVGIGLAGAGVLLADRCCPLGGRVLTLTGAGLALAAIPIAVVAVPAESVVFALIPGLVGLFVLAAALRPVRATWARSLVKLGTSFVFVGVVMAALFRLAPANRVLVGAGLVVVAWDVSDNAIGIGEQLGTGAATRQIELVHAGASLAVAAVGVVAAAAVEGVSIGASSLEAFVLLLVAVILLSLSLHG